MNLKRIEQFHKTRLGHLVFGLVELALAYGVALKAIDNGSLVLWTLVMILLIGFAQNIAHTVVKPRPVKQQKAHS